MLQAKDLFVQIDHAVRVFQQLIDPSERTTVQAIQYLQKQEPLSRKGQELIRNDKKTLGSGFQCACQRHIFPVSITEYARNGAFYLRKNRHSPLHVPFELFCRAALTGTA